MCLTQNKEVCGVRNRPCVFLCVGGCGETQKVRLAVVATATTEAAAAAAAVVVVLSTSSFKTFELEVLISSMK